MRIKILSGCCLLVFTGFFFHSLLPSWYHKRKNPKVLRDTKEKADIMLTFDDGPDPRYTPRILDLLAEEEVKATFFIVLEQAQEYEYLVKRMVNEGHMVGFHSKKHQNLMFRSLWYTRKELKEGCVFLQKIGIKKLYYRPPWGLTNVFTWHYVQKNHMILVLWSVLAQDWSKQATVDSIVERCRSGEKHQGIVCFHDAGEKTGGAFGAPEKTIAALKILIPWWKQDGYHFV